MSSHVCSPEDVQHQQVTQSSILLLLQEATKLTPPAGDERLRSAPSHVESEDSGSLVLSGREDPEFSGSFSVVQESERSSSAWEVMRLINQQCEQLLQSGCEDRGALDLHPSDASETVLTPRPPSEPECPADACSSVIELTDVENIKDPQDLAELIKTHTADHIRTSEETENTSVLHGSRDQGHSDHEESVVPSTGNDCAPISPLDFTSCLVSERDSESVWLPLNASENTPCSSQSADLNNNLLESVHKELQTCLWDTGRRTQRKQPRPTRSPDPQDPEVQGVTFSMAPQLDAGQSRLVITSNYSEEIQRWRRSRSSRSRTQRSSSEEESDCCGVSRQYCTPAPEGITHTLTHTLYTHSLTHTLLVTGARAESVKAECKRSVCAPDMNDSQGCRFDFEIKAKIPHFAFMI
ncbi:GATA-type zinc finger protein 1 isoform X1 [Carassius gibelio]|uniref:GATA-type zinc finger protein 1 isoform X1 n=1 Tax=Carassius gibelio TaxID=101364 RepID=UPI0022783FF6|nr:GATA-type zinc finger protein 1 isoform X1 [Carassius gibelio]XP_052455003.1 GATA-type zinc finger protein 1 isoform X1 [Carassius gibelio]